MKTFNFKKTDASGFDKVIIQLKRYTELLKNGEYEIVVKRKSKKRTIDANNYFWCLLDSLAAATGIRKEEIYRNYIKDIGGNNQTVCVKNEAVKRLCEGWQHNGLGWVTDTFESKIKGCTNVILYYGSSTYDTRQMSRLINLAVEDARMFDIETLAPHEIERLIKMSEDKRNGNT